MKIRIGNIEFLDWHHTLDNTNCFWRQAIDLQDGNRSCGFVMIQKTDSNCYRVDFSLVEVVNTYQTMYDSELIMSLEEIKDFIDQFLVKMSKLTAFS